MTDNANTATQIQFPPVPLLSGNAAVAEDGSLNQVSEVLVTVRLENGETLEVPLESKFGGWWAPTNK